MSLFFCLSDGQLVEPKGPQFTGHAEFKPVTKGAPLLAEIRLMAFGLLKEQGSTAEVAVFSNAGTTSKLGGRVVNFLRKGVEKKFAVIDSFFSDEEGVANEVLFYTPAFNGGAFNLKVQFIEIDNDFKLGAGQISKLNEALQTFGTLFVARLPFVTQIGDMIEIGKKIAGAFNQNDKILEEAIGLQAAGSAFVPRLSEGRYLLLEGSQSTAFKQNFKLEENGNKLIRVDGSETTETDKVPPYLVFEILSVEKPDYKEFELDSQTQKVVDDILERGKAGLSAELYAVVTDALKVKERYKTVEKILTLKRQSDAETDGGKKAALLKEIEELLKILPDNQVSLLKTALQLS